MGLICMFSIQSPAVVGGPSVLGAASKASCGSASAAQRVSRVRRPYTSVVCRAAASEQARIFLAAHLLRNVVMVVPLLTRFSLSLAGGGGRMDSDRPDNLRGASKQCAPFSVPAFQYTADCLLAMHLDCLCCSQWPPWIEFWEPLLCATGSVAEA